ncbi:NAD(P)-dependent oxidoreductase [Paenibacillus sp. MMS20-IR301]|uniref:NAD(P)-dependent oxidoreductase n=1 Tax=Paenibacillus sp. MMS20-IR301 TaxID=2895946 RepID=UPI0028F03739|nr:NAD(P)-dependent oxidoreductase [Paenibacillus sp. MMS20-IR301]WNS45848.1 NAD(P)-dependent oxidoreductase [Paenibacillus sp. MMS20-IR301]
MNIAVIGAGGKAGSKIVKEALSRGHEVTAIVRDASKAAGTKASVVEKDIFALTAEDLQRYDAVVNAFAAPFGQEHQHVDAGNVLIQALQNAPDTRLIVVGGAGSLYVDEAHSMKVVDTPGFPDFVKPTALNQGKNLEILQGTQGLRWTFVSPSANFAVGERRGAYVKGKDQLLVNSKGESYVSYADYAIAIVDELEHPQHIGERFTVVSES